MSATEIWLTILLLGAVSVLCRSFFLLVGSRLTMSDALQRGIRYAPLGALVAVIVPELVLLRDPSGVYAFSAKSPQLWGGVCASAAFLRWRSIFATAACGMAAYTAVRLLG